MGFLQSPGVQIREFDLTTIIPAVSTTTGAISGVFRWGPVDQITFVSDESSLVKRFGEPRNFNAETWFSASSFLAYTSALAVVRTGNTTSTNGSIGMLTAYANQTAVSNVLNLIVKNEDHFAAITGTFESGVPWLARFPGDLGNSLRVSECFSNANYTESLNLASYGSGGDFLMNVNQNTATFTINAASITLANTAALAFEADIAVTDVIELGNSDIGLQYLKVTEVEYDSGTDATGNSTTGTAVVTLHFEEPYQLSTDFAVDDLLVRYWEFFSRVSAAPGQSDYQATQGNTSAQDEMHVVIVDDEGKFTGVPGTVLETYQGLSRATDALGEDGSSIYYQTVINQASEYVYAAQDHTGALSNTSTNLADATASSPVTMSFSGGADGASEANVSVGMLAKGYDKFKSPEDVDVSLIIMGRARGGINGTQMANYVIDNICEPRMDCVAFISPEKADVVNNPGDEVDDMIDFRNQLRSSSYGFLDSGYKYIYDRYNDIYRYVPLNGDMAGLTAKTENTHDAWWSPAGFNRGTVKNIVRLAFNPKRPDRDRLYPAGINPVTTFPLNGTVLFGDKTLLAKPSAFDRINVRRLFIVLEKAIGEAAKYSLFEFNDPFTRALFKNMVNPYLRDIKGRRGLTDFLVVCDDSNNPGVVIDRNEFVAAIYLKPARSINFIRLDFIAVPTGIAFSEVVGRYGG
jgi:hypothetical protein